MEKSLEKKSSTGAFQKKTEQEFLPELCHALSDYVI